MSVYNLLVKIGGDARALTKSLDGMVGNFKGAFADIAKIAAGNILADAAANIGSGLLNVGKSAITMAGELEQTKVAFETMLGSAEKSEAFLKDLAQFAANTPFEMKGLQDSSKKLLAFGFDSQKIIPMMTAIGNAVGGLGGGAAEIDRVTMAMGQMQAKGKVSAEEMMQLAELGIPAWDMLAKTIGTDVPTAMDMASKGAIPAGAAIEGLINGMNERFPNMMEKQSKTMLGAWSNLQDGISAVLVRIGTEFADTFNLTGIIQHVSGLFSDFAANIDALGLGGALANLFSPELKAAIIGIGGAVTIALIPAMQAAAVAFAATVVAAAPFIATAAAIGGAAYVIMKNWGSISGFFVGLWNGLLDGVKGFVDGFKSGFNFLGQIVASVVDFIKDKLSFVLKFLPKEMQDAIKGAGNAALKLPDLVLAPVKQTVSNVGAAAKGMVTAITGPASEAIVAVQGFFTKAESTLPAQATKVATATGKAIATGLGGTSKEAAKQAKKIAEIFSDLKVAETMAVQFNTGADVVKAQMSAVESAAKKLMDEGISPQDKRVKELVARYQELSKKLEETKAPTFDVSGAMKDMALSLDAAKTKAAVLGESFDLSKEQGKILKDTLEKLAENGVKPSDAAMTELKETAKRLGIDLSKTGKKADEAKKPLDNMKSSITDMMSAIGGLRDGVKRIGEAFGTNFNDPVVNAIMSAGDFGLSMIQAAASAQSLIGMLQAANIWTHAVTAAQWLWNAAMTANPIGLIIIGIGALIAGIVAVVKHWDVVSSFLTQSWQALASFAGAVFGGLRDGLVAVFTGLIGVLKAPFNWIISAINMAIDLVNGINMEVPSWVPGIGGQRWGFNLPHVPYLAEGGIVTQPTMAVVGEGADDEAVLPLNQATFDALGASIASSLGQLGGSKGGDTHFHITIQAGAFLGDEAQADEWARMLGIRLNRMQLRTT